MLGRAGLAASSNQTVANATRWQPNNANFSFQVADIDLPLLPAEGSFHSAMRLLSAFSSQFDHIMPGDEQEAAAEAEDEDEEEQDGDGEPVRVGGQAAAAAAAAAMNVVRFRENRLHLSGLNLSMLNVHLYAEGSDPKFGIGITIKNTTLDGRFSYKGPLAPLTSSAGSNSLKGFYSMSIDSIYLLVSSNLTKVTINGSSPSALRLKTNEFKLNVTSLGYISIDIYDSKDLAAVANRNSSRPTAIRQPTSNYVLKMLQKVLQRTIKRTYLTFEHHIQRALELEGRRALDCELTRFDDLLRISNDTTPQAAAAKANASVPIKQTQGDFARVIDREIVHSGFSRVELPNFEHQQSVLGSTARISFYNGSLSGLNTIKMIGETRIKLQEQHLIMNTSLGWLELRPYYSWNLTLGGGGSSATGNSSTAFRAPVSQGFVSFTIKDVSYLTLDLRAIFIAQYWFSD